MIADKNRFVIFEPTMLVALDLEGCLRDHDPDADVVIAPSLADALRMMAEGSATLAVLHAASERVPAMPVPVLLIGDAAEERPGSRHVLMRPFSTDDVSRAVIRLGIRPGLTPV